MIVDNNFIIKLSILNVKSLEKAELIFFYAPVHFRGGRKKQHVENFKFLYSFISMLIKFIIDLRNV